MLELSCPQALEGQPLLYMTKVIGLSNCTSNYPLNTQGLQVRGLGDGVEMDGGPGQDQERWYPQAGNTHRHLGVRGRAGTSAVRTSASLNAFLVPTPYSVLCNIFSGPAQCRPLPLPGGSRACFIISAHPQH